MNTATFKIRYRPVKIGFLIEENSIDHLVKAAEINTMLWGGIYNPIIPVSDEKKYTKEFFENFQVDILYDLSKTEKTSAFIDEYPYLKPSMGAMKEIFLDYYKQFAYIDVGNPISNSVLVEKVKNPLFFKCANEYKHFNLFKVLFGFYPKIENCDFDFLKEFLEILKPEIRVMDDNKTSLGAFHDAVTPIELTRIDIAQYWSIKDHYTLRHSNNSIFIGSANSFDDLIYYWNLRAYGYNLNFYSTDDQNLFEENTVRFIKTFDKPESEVKHGPECSVFFRKDSESYFDHIRAKMQSNPFYCSLHNTYLGILNYDKPFGYFKNESFDALAHINEGQNGGYDVSFSLPNIPFSNSEKRDTSKQFFITSVSPESEPFYKYTFSLPYIPDLHESYSRKIVGQFNPFELRCEPTGFGVLLNNEKRTLTIHPILFRDIIFEMFKEAGLEPQQSQPGLLTIKIINKLGHLDSCRVFKIRGVRKVFRSLNVEDTIVRSNIEKEIWDNGNFRKYQGLYIEKRTTKDLKQRDVVDYLFRHDFFRPGLELRCGSCNLENWLSVKRLDDFWTCEFCGSKNQLNTALKDRGDWKFRKSGLFGKNNNQEGAIPVILTLLQLYRCLQGISSKQTMIYETATKFITPRNCEIDFSVVNLNDLDDFEIGFGECKDEGGNIDANDIENLKFVYEAFKRKCYKPYIIIAKAADRFSEDEINLFKKVKADEYRLILMTNRELEPYNIYDEYRGKIKLPREHPFSLQDLHWNSDFIYLKDQEENKGGIMY